VLQSYLTGLGGNTLLLSYFAGKHERNAVIVQALGILSSFAVITQIRTAGFMPRAAYAALAAVVGLQAILTGLKLSGRLEGSKAGQRVWGGWQKLLGLAGLAGVPQVLWATFLPHTPSLLPSTLTFTAGCAALVAETAGALPPRLRGLWAATSAWTATALFMLQPVSQLARNFQAGGRRSRPAHALLVSPARLLLSCSCCRVCWSAAQNRKRRWPHVSLHTASLLVSIPPPPPLPAGPSQPAGPQPGHHPAGGGGQRADGAARAVDLRLGLAHRLPLGLHLLWLGPAAEVRRRAAPGGPVQRCLWAAAVL
jgi:hypothetical protein